MVAHFIFTKELAINQGIFFINSVCHLKQYFPRIVGMSFCLYVRLSLSCPSPPKKVENTENVAEKIFMNTSRVTKMHS